MKLPVDHHKYDAWFKAAARDAVGADSYPIFSWLLLKAQAIQESGLDPTAVNKASGAKGIAQFMPRTWEEWCKGGDPFNVEDAIPAQARYMTWIYLRLMRRSQSHCLTNAVLAAYNWGYGHICKHLEFNHRQLIPSQLPRETADYIIRIRAYLELLKKEEADAAETRQE